jgi:hypothetical protein
MMDDSKELLAQRFGKELAILNRSDARYDPLPAPSFF